MPAASAITKLCAAYIALRRGVSLSISVVRPKTRRASPAHEAIQQSLSAEERPFSFVEIDDTYTISCRRGIAYNDLFAATRKKRTSQRTHRLSEGDVDRTEFGSLALRQRIDGSMRTSTCNSRPAYRQ